MRPALCAAPPFVLQALERRLERVEPVFGSYQHFWTSFGEERRFERRWSGACQCSSVYNAIINEVCLDAALSVHSALRTVQITGPSSAPSNSGRQSSCVTATAISRLRRDENS